MPFRRAYPLNNASYRSLFSKTRMPVQNDIFHYALQIDRAHASPLSTPAELSATVSLCQLSCTAIDCGRTRTCALRRNRRTSPPANALHQDSVTRCHLIQATFSSLQSQWKTLKLSHRFSGPRCMDKLSCFSFQCIGKEFCESLPPLSADRLPFRGKACSRSFLGCSNAGSNFSRCYRCHYEQHAAWSTKSRQIHSATLRAGPHSWMHSLL